MANKLQTTYYDKYIKLAIKNGIIDVDIKRGIILGREYTDTTGKKFRNEIGSVIQGEHKFSLPVSYSPCINRMALTIRAVYIKAFGHIPKNHKIIRKDRNLKNNKINNLCLERQKEDIRIMRWTEKDIEKLKKLQKSLSLPQLAKYFRRSIKSIRQKLNQVYKKSRIPKNSNRKPWTKKEDILLKQLCYNQNTPIDQISKKMNRSIHAIRQRCNKFLNLYRDQRLIQKNFKSDNFYLALKAKISRGSAGAECCLCGYNKYIDLHHIDNNNQNNKRANIASLCPNCHREVSRGHHKNKRLFCIWWRLDNNKKIIHLQNNKKEVKIFSE